MNLRLMMNASQFYALSRQLQNAYAAQMRPLCEETGMAQTAIDILLFLHNNPGCDTARDICTYRQLKPALVSLYVENLVQSGHLRRESVPEDRRKCRLLLTAQALPVVEKGLALQAAFTAQMFAGLSKEDLASGQRCLAAVTQNIQTINRFWARNRSANCSCGWPCRRSSPNSSTCSITSWTASTSATLPKSGALR